MYASRRFVKWNIEAADSESGFASEHFQSARQAARGQPMRCKAAQGNITQPSNQGNATQNEQREWGNGKAHDARQDNQGEGTKLTNSMRSNSCQRDMIFGKARQCKTKRRKAKPKEAKLTTQKINYGWLNIWIIKSKSLTNQIWNRRPNIGNCTPNQWPQTENRKPKHENANT